MALLAEELVEEWLRRKGHFTIRGIKLGVQEIDLLAVRRNQDGSVTCRHVEVQASIRPVSYISKVPRAAQRMGRAANSAKRSEQELLEGVSEWVKTKFHRPDKKALRRALWPGKWQLELVIGNVKSEQEVSQIETHGIGIIRLATVIKELSSPNPVVPSASSADFVELLHLVKAA
jgi:hypothetical protein